MSLFPLFVSLYPACQQDPTYPRESPFQNAHDPVVCCSSWCFTKYPLALFHDCFMHSYSGAFFAVRHWVCLVFPLSESVWVHWAQVNADRFIRWNIVVAYRKKQRPGNPETWFCYLGWIPSPLWVAVFICKMKELNWIISKVYAKSKILGLIKRDSHCFYLSVCILHCNLLSCPWLITCTYYLDACNLKKNYRPLSERGHRGEWGNIEEYLEADGFQSWI